jgi:hypothetical protein
MESASRSPSSAVASRTAAIMQPTYLPWAGYLDLIDRADCFVFLDSVQFAKRSWQQRNRVKKAGPDPIQWLTVPVLTKGRRDQLIADVEIDPTSEFPEGHLATLRHLYAKAPFFDQYFDELQTIVRGQTRLADLNIGLITWLCRSIGIECEMARSSQLDASGRRADLLANICQVVRADRYLSAAGSKEYIDEYDPFTANGIELVYQEYHPTEYRQLHGTFEPFLSALDLMFNEGPESLRVIRAGSAIAPGVDAGVPDPEGQ